MADMQALATLIRAAADEAGGYRALARRASNTPSAATFNNIVVGRHSGVFTSETVRGIARALERPLREVERLTGTDFGHVRPPFTLPDRANGLTQPQRKVVLSVVDAILNAAQVAAVVPIRAQVESAPKERAVAHKGDPVDRAEVRRLAREEREKQGK